MKYFATVAGRDCEIELTPEGIRLHGRSRRAEIAHVPASRLGHLRLDDEGFAFTAHRVDGGWRITIAGRSQVIQVEDERARAIRELSARSGAADARRDLVAPMPGLILRVMVAAGQRVEAGASLVVIEAMKMENELLAETTGTVAAVEVDEGDTVNRDDLIIRFETEPG